MDTMCTCNTKNRYCQKPIGFASGFKKNSKWSWTPAKWVHCRCGLWHSNRFIPKDFWNQKWTPRVQIGRRKAGVILVRDFKEFWITQSYNRCYGFPKGECEIGETLEECAKREFKEETGLNIDRLDMSKFQQVRTFIENVEYVYFVIHVPREFDILAFPPDDVEITSFGWVGVSNIKSLVLSKAVRKILLGNYGII